LFTEGDEDRELLLRDTEDGALLLRVEELLSEDTALRVVRVVVVVPLFTVPEREEEDEPELTLDERVERFELLTAAFDELRVVPVLNDELLPDELLRVVTPSRVEREDVALRVDAVLRPPLTPDER
jgi:hypothetical protein